MRQFVAAFAMVALTACGGPAKDDAPSPGDAATSGAGQDGTPSKGGTAVTNKVVKLSADGLEAGPEAFLFEAGRSEVETALKTVLGDPIDGGPMPECGAGPMDFTAYAGRLVVNFQDGKLVGWNWAEPRDVDPPASGEITIDGPVKLGAARASVEAVPGFEMFVDSTLGDEFMINEKLFGFFEAGKVSMLYTGTQCFFR